MKRMSIVAVSLVFILWVGIRLFYLIQAESTKTLEGRILFSGSIGGVKGDIPAVGEYDFKKKETLIFKTDGFAFDPVYNPSKEKIIYRIHTTKDVVVKNINNAKTKVFFDSVNGRYTHSVPFWSADGNIMVFSSSEGNIKRGVFLKYTHNESIEKILDATYLPNAAMISPDGTKVSFIGYNPDEAKRKIANPRLYVMNLSDSKLENIGNIDQVVMYGWSPDNSKLCYISRRDRQIHVVNSDGTNDRVVTKLKSMGWQCSFSPDGTRIIFDYIPPYGQTTPREIYVINTDGTGLKRIYPKGNWTSVYSPTWVK